MSSLTQIALLFGVVIGLWESQGNIIQITHSSTTKSPNPTVPVNHLAPADHILVGVPVLPWAV